MLNGRRIRCFCSCPAKDKALWVARILTTHPRVGQGGDDIVLADGLDTIDASDFDTGLIGHGYFASDHQVMNDLAVVVNQMLPPQQRKLKAVPRIPPLRLWLLSP
jgi:hypothetical protein